MTCSLNKGLHGNSISALRHGGGEGGGMALAGARNHRC